MFYIFIMLVYVEYEGKLKKNSTHLLTVLVIWGIIKIPRALLFIYVAAKYENVLLQLHRVRERNKKFPTSYSRRPTIGCLFLI